uniref:hypothetical protein n=1 Tax=Klebsiella pneumoniae TaxID=573 RepID=UPI001954F504
MDNDRLKGLLLPLAAVLAMEAWLRWSGIQSESLAPPSQVLVALFGALTDGSMLAATGETLIGAFTGLVI